MQTGSCGLCCYWGAFKKFLWLSQGLYSFFIFYVTFLSFFLLYLWWPSLFLPWRSLHLILKSLVWWNFLDQEALAVKESAPVHTKSLLLFVSVAHQKIWNLILRRFHLDYERGWTDQSSSIMSSKELLRYGSRLFEHKPHEVLLEAF